MKLIVLAVVSLPDRKKKMAFAVISSFVKPGNYGGK